MIVEAAKRMLSSFAVDPVHPRDPVLAKMFGLGTATSAGVSVDPESAMSIPPVKRAVQIVTDKVFGLPWSVYRERPEGRVPDPTHPAWEPVTTKANIELDDATVRQQLTQWAMLWGNGVAAVRRPDGWPTSGSLELYPLLPDRTQLIRVSGRAAAAVGDGVQAGQLFYKTRVANRDVAFSQGDVVHLRGLGPNPYWGYDIVYLCQEVFGGAQAKEQFSNRLFGQGGTPAGFIEMDGSLPEEEEENVIESLKRGMHGLGNTHKLILLEYGMKYKQATIDPDKSQMLPGREFDVRLVSMVMGIKPHKLIDSANSAFASLEAANDEHKDDDIMPWLNKWRKQYNSKLLTAKQYRTRSFSIDVDDSELDYVPFSDRASGTVELYNNGLITKDEGRRAVNKGPSLSSRADEYRIPANIIYEDDQAMVSAGTSQPEAELSDVSQAYLANIRKRLVKTAQAKARKGASTFLDWVDGVEPEDGPQSIQTHIHTEYKRLTHRCKEIALEAKTDDELRKLTDEIRPE